MPAIILLEYIVAQYQHRNVSVAINSRKVRQHNPAIVIARASGLFVWQLRGLHLGDVETVSGQARANRIDFYIGMDDLDEQRQLFPRTQAHSLGLPDGLRIPVGRERPGGKRIRWRGPVSRIHISEASMVIPTYKFSHNPQADCILNLDRETSPYPIMSDNDSRTTRELHFGLEHDFNVRQSATLRIPRIEFKMTSRQYATVLEALDNSIARHRI